MEEIVLVEVRPPNIIVHKKEVIPLETIDLSLPQFEWLKEQGITRAYREFYGYAIGKTRRGTWVKIDLRYKEVLWGTESTIDLKNYILSQVIPEAEWGPWVKKVRVRGERRL